MALDFIGVGGCGGEEGGWLAAEEGLAGGNPAQPIGAIVRAMVVILRLTSWRGGGSAATISCCSHSHLQHIVMQI